MSRRGKTQTEVLDEIRDLVCLYHLIPQVILGFILGVGFGSLVLVHAFGRKEEVKNRMWCQRCFLLHLYTWHNSCYMGVLSVFIVCTLQC